MTTESLFGISTMNLETQDTFLALFLSSPTYSNGPEMPTHLNQSPRDHGTGVQILTSLTIFKPANLISSLSTFTPSNLHSLNSK